MEDRMNKKPVVNRSENEPRAAVTWEERLRDHENKIEEYLQNRLVRGCNPETTLRGNRSALLSTFRRVQVEDATHRDERRQLLIWELLNPAKGSYYVGLIGTSMIRDNLAIETRRGYMSCLRDFCDYVLVRPYVPNGNGTTFMDKYGPMTQTLTKYDLLIHSQDRPVKKRYALAPTLLDDLYEFLRTDYIANRAVRHLAARDFVAIVLQAETGARTNELLGIRSSGNECDIDWSKQRLRIFGKGKSFSGKRIRWVPLSAYAIEVLRVFERVFKPIYPTTPDSDYLFLNRTGGRLSAGRYWRIFRKIVDLATKAGVEIPLDLRPHDLRRTCATNALERDPVAYRKVLRRLGHTYPSSAAPYLIATDDDVEDEQNDLIDIFVDPYINVRRKQ
jgi:integrase